MFGFEISLMFVVGAYFVLHSTFLYSQKPPNTPAPASEPSGAAATTGTANGITSTGGVGEMELPEKESLLGGQGYQSASDSPRSRSGKSVSTSEGGALARKSSSKFASERDTDPV